MAEPAKTTRPGTWESLKIAFGNPRLRAVALQSYASGLPLGLVWIAIPAWLKYKNFDIRTIGLFSLAQAPWNFKFLWSPLMDRYSPKFLGRKRSWMVLTEMLLVISIALLAKLSATPDFTPVFLLGLLIAFASASQDIVIDGYAVEILEKDEFGKAVGARVALYRVAMYLSGGFAITAGESWGWPAVFLGIAAMFVPMIAIVVASPEPHVLPAAPKSLRAAVVEPMLGMFKKNRALEILLFIVLYKLGENLATALIRPFLIEKGFTPADVGVAITTISFFTTVGGTIVGGVLTDRIGIGRTLWLSGILQALGCLGYAVVDVIGGPKTNDLWEMHRVVMYSSLALEQIFQGMGAGALGVLMLRLTSKEFSATQFALLSSLMALPRVIVGPFAGVLAYSLGWTVFFLLTVPIAIPGLVMLNKFVPFGAKDAIVGADEEAGTQIPITRRELTSKGVIAFLLSLVIAGGWNTLLAAMADSRKVLGTSRVLALKWLFVEHRLEIHYAALIHPADAMEWVDLIGPIVFALLVGGATAALLAARRGVKR